MKYIIILGDGMSDEPIEALGGRTPLQVAKKPNMDRLAKLGRSGLLDTIPEGYAPGSEIANLSLLGYDLPTEFEGRGSLEAASMGIPIENGEMAMRCNLIALDGNKIKNHSAGHISTEDATELIEFLQQNLGGEKFRRGDLEANFYAGVSYRHLLKIKNGRKELECYPPHDHLGERVSDLMIRAVDPQAEQTAKYLNELTIKSQALLREHPVNQRRRASGLAAADSIWLWSPGYKPKMQTLKEKYGVASGAVISAVDLIKGIGRLAGLDVVEVEGATGLHDTNYEGKMQAALKELREKEFVFLHIEASDEAGHEGDVELKIKTIEYLDSRVVGSIMEEVAKWDEPVAVALLPDHPTPCDLKTHTDDPVPFTIYNPEAEPDGVEVYDEFSVRSGAYGLLEGDEFMKALIKKQ